MSGKNVKRRLQKTRREKERAVAGKKCQKNNVEKGAAKSNL